MDKNLLIPEVQSTSVANQGRILCSSIAILFNATSIETF